MLVVDEDNFKLLIKKCLFFKRKSLNTLLKIHFFRKITFVKCGILNNFA